MRDELLDILQHTLGLGVITEIKITGSGTETLIDAMDENNAVVIKGKLKTANAALEGEYGLRYLDRLKAYLNDPNYKSDDANISIKTDTRNGKKTPVEILFENVGAKDSTVYRLVSPELCRDYFDFKGADWTVSFSPSKSIVSNFAYKAAAAGSESANFTTSSNDDGDIIIAVGEGMSSSSILFGDGTDHKLKFELRWPTALILSVLKLDEGNVEVDILDDPRSGALQVRVDTKLAEWQYIFPQVK